VHKRKAGPGHRILQERAIAGAVGRRCLRPQMQKSTDKTVAAISVITRAARPAAVVGKKLEH